MQMSIHKNIQQYVEMNHISKTVENYNVLKHPPDHTAGPI